MSLTKSNERPAEDVLLPLVLGRRYLYLYHTMRNVLTTALLLATLAHSSVKRADADDNAEGWYAPAYTEPMDSILLLAQDPDVQFADPSKFTYPDTITAVQAELAKALHTHVHVRVLVDPKSTAHQQRSFELALM